MRHRVPAVRLFGRARFSHAAPWLLALAYLLAHLPYLAPTLEDIDSINFALGLRDFDPGKHQPHPPGYPVYIALGRISLAALHGFRAALPQPSAEALALAIWSAFGGAAAVVLSWHLATMLAATRTTAIAAWAAALLAAAPLFWLTGARPMSDMPGLAAALGAQVLLLRQHTTAGVFLAAFAFGIRLQTVWLTLPLALWEVLRQRSVPVAGRALLACAAGILVWAIPLLAASGGLDAYMRVLSAQAGEDFAFVDMLWANPTPRRLALNLRDTFFLPWVSVRLARVVLAAAACGIIVMLVRERRALLVLLVAFGPYAAFHLLFQETLTVRYALPILVPIAFAAVRGLAVFGRWLPWLGAPLAAVSLAVALPAAIAYGTDPNPAFRALADAAARAPSQPNAVVFAHFDMNRPLEAAPPPGVRVVPTRPRYEWLELGRYWQTGGAAPVWFFANPQRTDLELIDPRSRDDFDRYRWKVASRPELGGSRPLGVDWYRLVPPRWFAAEGWALTPETGGVARASGKGPDHAPIVAFVRPGREPMRLMVGGRHLGGTGDGAADLELSIDGRVADRWRLGFEQGSFLRFLELRDGIPSVAAPYSRLTIASRAADGSTRRIPVAIRQFDLQQATDVVFGFGPGWHDDEYTTETGMRWRWASERAVLQVRGPHAPVRVRIRGESPLRYFDVPPTVTLSAGRIITRIEPTDDFELDVVVPADALAASGGDIVLETSRVFVPAEAGSSPDMRRLGLRIFACHVRSAR